MLGTTSQSCGKCVSDEIYRDTNKETEKRVVEKSVWRKFESFISGEAKGPVVGEESR